MKQTPILHRVRRVPLEKCSIRPSQEFIKFAWRQIIFLRFSRVKEKRTGAGF